MTLTPIRRHNRTLAVSGWRVCECCLALMHLDTDHFYRNHRSYAYVCKRCWRFRENEKARKRYHSDPAFREARLASARASHAANRERHNARQRAYRQRKAAQQAVAVLPLKDTQHKRAKFRRVWTEWARERLTAVQP